MTRLQASRRTAIGTIDDVERHKNERSESNEVKCLGVQCVDIREVMYELGPTWPYISWLSPGSEYQTPADRQGVAVSMCGRSTQVTLKVPED